MHRILSLLAFALFILEVVFHRELGKKGLISITKVHEGLKLNFDRFDLLRLIELLFLGLILSTKEGNPASSSGQICMVLVALQISRLLGRRILSRWSVLGVLQALEAGLLLTFILLPINHSSSVYTLLPGTMLAIPGGITYALFVSLSASFSISYWIKLYARESSKTYESFPPLADSEGWAEKFSGFSLVAGAFSVAGLILLKNLTVLSVGFAISYALQFSGVLFCRKQTFKGHHPRVHILWGLSCLILYFLAVSGITTVSTLAL